MRDSVECDFSFAKHRTGDSEGFPFFNSAMKKTVLIFFFISLSLLSQGKSIAFEKFNADQKISSDTNEIIVGTDKIHVSKSENKKLIAAILAFPVPFGFTGLHRIYLGTDPWVPVLYFATLGGGMLLPLMDFIAIVFASDEELQQFENNPRVFMWVK